VHTGSQTARRRCRRDHADVTRVFEMLSALSEISFLECLRKRKRIKLKW